MKELNIPFEEKMHPFGQSDFLEFSPSGKVPCLYDADFAVWDSLAICEYLAEGHKHVWPEDRYSRAWARTVVAEMHSGFNVLRETCGMNIGVRARLKNIESGLVNDISRIDQIWTEGQAKFGGPFLAGETFSAVDAFFAPIAFRYQTYELPISNAPRKYCELLLSLENMKLWEAEALRETWRDEAHEDELTQFGAIIEDKRNA
jgi:glutathione S-transferase